MKLKGKIAAFALATMLAGPALADDGNKAAASAPAAADLSGHSSYDALAWEQIPNSTSKHAMFFKADDNRLALGAANFATMTTTNVWAFDNVSYVISGSAEITEKGKAPVKVQAGDVFFIAKGTEITVVNSDNFKAVHFVSSDTPIDFSHGANPPPPSATAAAVSCAPKKPEAVQVPEAGVHVWHSAYESLKWTPMDIGQPDQKVMQSVLFRSADGTRLASTFHASGRIPSTWDFNEVGYVISGTAHVTMSNGSTYELKAGDLFYWKKGAAAEMHMSADYREIVDIVSQCPVE